MARYAIMKRLTQILASSLFVLTVLTVYLAFDFAVSKAMPEKPPSTEHEPDDIKFQRKSPLLSIATRDNLNLRQVPDVIRHERPMRSVHSTRMRPKPAPFHKSKTGVKVNQMKKPLQQGRKSSVTTTKRSVGKQLRNH